MAGVLDLGCNAQASHSAAPAPAPKAAVAAEKTTEILAVAALAADTEDTADDVSQTASRPGSGRGPASADRSRIGECRERGDTAGFSLVHLNDLQARYSDRIDGKSRYARLSGLIQGIRAESPATLVLDAGDDFEKGSLADVRSGGATTRRIVHAMPFDVRTLGNHDFAYGDASVRSDLAESPHFVLAANLRDREDPNRFRGYVRVDVGCVRVGVLGLVTSPYGSDDEQIVTASYGAFEQDPRVVRVATELVRQHRGEVDVMVALTHLGKVADTYLVQQVPGIDFVVGGHSEDTLQKPLRVVRPDGSNALVFQAGHFGEQIGRADVIVDLRGGKVDVDRYRLLPVDGSAPADPAIETLVARAEAESTPGLLEPVGNVLKERAPRELSMLVAHAAKTALGADAVLMGRDSFWGKLPAGPVSLQRLYELVYVQRQPSGTPGFTSLWTLEVSPEEFARIRARVKGGPRYVFEVPGGAVPSKPKLRIAVEKRIVEHAALATNPPAKFDGAAFGGELIDVLETYARAQAAKKAAIDAPL